MSEETVSEADCGMLRAEREVPKRETPAEREVGLGSRYRGHSVGEVSRYDRGNL